MFAEPPELTLPPPRPLRPRIWRARDILGGLGMVVAGFLIVVVGLGVYVGATGDDNTDTPGVVATLFFELLIGATVLFLASRRRLGFRDLGFVLPRRWGFLGLVWAGAYGILVAYQIVLVLLERAGLDVSRLSEGNPLPVEGDSVPLLIVLGVAVVLVAPVSEELFFRGLLFRGMRGYWRLLPSMALSGLVFGAFHGNLSVFLPFAFIGALFAWGFEESDSLLTPILTHMLVNGVSFALSVAGAGN
ncbi:MAG: CPBP family intramembrane metalloprotease [Dehalococcoidia bacterium]|nr:CPBP family intramembrane metalloprotease [Dehalococcoidia bacterium]